MLQVQNCFDRDPNIAPSTPEETFGGLVERDGKFAKRVVYAVKEMFGIEFAPEVVKADGKVANLGWRVWEAKKVLVSAAAIVPINRPSALFKSNSRPKISLTDVLS